MEFKLPEENFKSFSGTEAAPESADVPPHLIKDDAGPNEQSERVSEKATNDDKDESVEVETPEKEEADDKTAVEDEEIAETEDETAPEIEEKISWETKAGKKHEATIQEMKNAWSLYTENKRRMSELDTQKRDVEEKFKKVETFNQFVDQIREKEGNDLLQTVLEEMHKVNPKIEGAMQKYYDSIFEEAKKVVQMTPQQREIYERDKKLSYYEGQEQKKKREEQQARQTEVVNQRLKSIKKSWEVDDSLLDNAYALALEKGHIKKDDAVETQLNVLEDVVTEYRFGQRAKEALKKAGVSTDDSGALNDLIDWQFRNQKAEQKDLIARAKKLYAPQAQSKQAPKMSDKSKRARRQEEETKQEQVILKGNQMPSNSKFNF